MLLECESASTRSTQLFKSILVISTKKTSQPSSLYYFLHVHFFREKQAATACINGGRESLLSFFSTGHEIISLSIAAVENGSQLFVLEHFDQANDPQLARGFDLLGSETGHLHFFRQGPKVQVVIAEAHHRRRSEYGAMLRCWEESPNVAFAALGGSYGEVGQLPRMRQHAAEPSLEDAIDLNVMEDEDGVEDGGSEVAQGAQVEAVDVGMQSVGMPFEDAGAIPASLQHIRESGARTVVVLQFRQSQQAD